MNNEKPEVVIVKKTAQVTYDRTVSSGIKFEFYRFDASVGVEGEVSRVKEERS